MWIEKHPTYAVIAQRVRFDEGDFTWMGFHNMHLKVTRTCPDPPGYSIVLNDA